MYVSISVWYLANDNLPINVRYLSQHKISNNIVRKIDEIDIIQRINKSKRLFLGKKIIK